MAVDDGLGSTLWSVQKTRVGYWYTMYTLIMLLVCREQLLNFFAVGVQLAAAV